MAAAFSFPSVASMPKPLTYDDPDWAEAAAHTGEMMQGHISDLRQIEPKGRPFTKRYAKPGFDITPGQTIKPKRKRKR
jgi:hypothetical protein